jgi:hypothetical protein
MENKFFQLLQSRKFWASVLGLLTSLGVATFADVDADTLVAAIAAIVGAFTLGTGIEDARK